MARKKTIDEFIGLRGTLYCTPPVSGKLFSRYVFQATMPGHGNLPHDRTGRHQVRIWTAGSNPRTPAQQARRVLFSLAVIAWHAADAETKNEFRRLARSSHANAYQLFIGAYLKTHTPATSGDWDGGASIWDSGTSVWDTIAGAQWDGGASIWDSGSSVWDI